MPSANTNVALLYQTQELGRHLRDALASLGTPIVYEAATDHLDPSALEQSGARVVIVNLDPEVESHLDDVYGLLEDDRYSVVFNDAQVSSGLSGWDQARWARHLAAKILGGDIDPPRPEGAEAVPAPAPLDARAANDIAPAADEADADDLDVAHEAEPSYASPPSTVDAPPEETVATTNAGDPLEMLESRYDEMNQPAAAAYPSPLAPPADAFDFTTLEALTAAPSPPAEKAAPEPTPAADFAEDSAGDSADTERFAPSAETDIRVDPESIADVFDLDALDKLFGDAPADEVVERAVAAPPASWDETMPDETLAQVPLDVGAIEDDAREARKDAKADVPDDPFGIDVASLALLDDIVFEEAPAAPSPVREIADEVPVPEVSAPPSTLKLAAAADWSLEDMLDGDGPPAGPVPTGRADFGIEKISAADYLAPSEENTAPPPVPEGAFSLELMPLEEAVAPQAIEREAHEAWLDPDKVVVPPKIRRVWVLGASIGGPEAVRDFLRELPRDYPALFLLAQHMGAEFVDLMAQQLAKATPLTVRTPTHGERVGHGEVVIVPTTHRLQVDPEGIVVLERVASDGAYSPSIDRVLRDVADKYGANAGAIIFSGMTSDAVEGSKYLASKGGTIYAQHPDSCVVSTMVDGVMEAGIVKFLGAASELAEQLIAETARNKR